MTSMSFPLIGRINPTEEWIERLCQKDYFLLNQSQASDLGSQNCQMENRSSYFTGGNASG
jgi:hypothetical protein